MLQEISVVWIGWKEWRQMLVIETAFCVCEIGKFVDDI